MGNSFFRFKQFTVHQERTAMKVCTDACLFGSLLPAGNFPQALDIGAGTGLLSLMFAQQHPQSMIDAVEIDADAALQADENFRNSPFQNLRLVHTDIMDHASLISNSYDIVFSNPPFYQHHLTSANEKKNMAHHGSTLSLQQLNAAVDRLLSRQGLFCVLLPYSRHAYFIDMAQKAGFYPQQIYLVKQTPVHDVFRSILFLARTKREMCMETITIREDAGGYSERFIALLKTYYLHL